MLPLTEYVGQLRGMGSGVAAKGKTTKEQLAMLDTIITQVVKVNSDFQKNIKSSINKGKDYYPQDMEAEVTKIDTAIKEYVSFAQKELYKEEVSVNPDDYFDAGTQIIIQIVSVYDKANKAVRKDSKGYI